MYKLNWLGVNLRKDIVVEYLNVRISGPISNPKPLHQRNVIK